MWTIETTHRPEPAQPASDNEKTAFVRGDLDPEGGILHDPRHRFHTQLVRKERADLDAFRTILLGRRIGCIREVAGG